MDAELLAEVDRRKAIAACQIGRVDALTDVRCAMSKSGLGILVGLTAIIALVIAVCAYLAERSSRFVPTAKLFSGTVEGCGEFVVAKYDSDQKLMVVVSYDDRTVPLPDGPTDLSIEKEGRLLSVGITKWARRVRHGICDDVANYVRVNREWRAISGTVRINKSTEPPPPEMMNAKYKVSVLLKDVVFEDDSTRATFFMDALEINDVAVGWLP